MPPDQMVGSSIKVTCEERNGKPALVRLPEINSIVSMKRDWRRVFPDR